MPAALFDLDGTLVDNMRFHAQAWVELCRRHGVEVPFERFHREFAGKKNEEILPIVFGAALSVADARRIADEKEALYREMFAPHLTLLPGAQALLERLRAAKVPCAIASAAPPLNRSFVLEGLKLMSYFDAVVGAEQAPRGKPHPDLFLLAAKAVGQPAASCVVFEDAVNGVLAGKAAGMTVVGLTTAFSAQALVAAGASVTVHDFTELPPETYRALIS